MESGWNVWVWLVGVVLRRYIDFLILFIPTPLVSVLFCSSIYIYIYPHGIYIYISPQYVIVRSHLAYFMAFKI